MRIKLLPLCLSMLTFSILVFISSCDDDEKPKTIPELTTATIADITTTTASGGGEITSDGNSTITAMGLVYSSSNSSPTIADSKTEETVNDGAFTSNLAGLTSGTTYHVRAYATNSVGTGYGDPVSFTTGNAAPVATNVLVTGTTQVPEVLTATYTYTDAESNPESGTTIKWYRANDGAGAGEVAIASATALTYTLQDADEFKYIRVGITPKSSAGNTTGVEVKSAFVGPIAEEPTTVTFPYNGTSVTYGIIESPVTGRKWLDRNLGAAHVATDYSSDFAAKGDLFQWGRRADGHQLINRAATSGTTTSVNETTTILSSTDTPGHSNFITVSTAPGDWRNPSNNNLWQGVNGVNNPCPSGWRLPTKDEMNAENLTDIETDFAQLKLTFTGLRFTDSGSFSGVNVYGLYWTSTIDPNGYPVSFYTDFFFTTDSRALGAACRCIKN